MYQDGHIQLALLRELCDRNDFRGLRLDINVAEYSSNLSSPGDIPVFFLAARVSTCLLQLYALHTLPSSCKKCPSRHLELRTGKYSFFFQIISVPSASSRSLVNFLRPKKRHEGRVTGCVNSVLRPWFLLPMNKVPCTLNGAI